MKFFNSWLETAYGFPVEVFHSTPYSDSCCPGKGSQSFYKCRKTAVPFIYFSVISHRKDTYRKSKERNSKQDVFFSGPEQNQGSKKKCTQREQDPAQKLYPFLFPGLTAEGMQFLFCRSRLIYYVKGKPAYEESQQYNKERNGFYVLYIVDHDRNKDYGNNKSYGNHQGSVSVSPFFQGFYAPFVCVGIDLFPCDLFLFEEIFLRLS